MKRNAKGWIARRLRDPEEAKAFNRARVKLEAATGVIELMDSEDVNQADLARRIGKSRSFVSKILSGEQNLTLETLADLYHALGRSVHFTLTDNERDPGAVRNPKTETRPPVDLAPTADSDDASKPRYRAVMHTGGFTNIVNPTAQTTGDSNVWKDSRTLSTEDYQGRGSAHPAGASGPLG